MIDDVIGFNDDVVRPANFFNGSGISFAELVIERGGVELSEERITTTFLARGAMESIISEAPPSRNGEAFSSFDTDINGDDLPNCHIVYKCQTRTDTGTGSRTNFGNTDDSNPNNDEDRVGNSEFTLIRKTTLEYNPLLDNFSREEEVITDSVTQSSTEVSAPTIVNDQDLVTTTATHTNFTRSGTTFFDNGSVSSIVSGLEAIELSNPLVTSDWLRDRATPILSSSAGVARSSHVNDVDQTNLEAEYLRQNITNEVTAEFTRISSPPDEVSGRVEQGVLSDFNTLVSDLDFSLSTYNRLGIESETGGDTVVSESEVGDIEFPYIGKSGSYASPSDVISGEPWRRVEMFGVILDTQETEGSNGSGFELRIDNLRNEKIRVNYEVDSFNIGSRRGFDSVMEEVEASSRVDVNITGGTRRTVLFFLNIERLVLTDQGEVWELITNEDEIRGCINVSVRDLTYDIAGNLGSKKATQETSSSFTKSVIYGCGTNRDLSYNESRKVTEWTNYGYFAQRFKSSVEAAMSGYNNNIESRSFVDDGINSGSFFGGSVSLPVGVTRYSQESGDFPLSSSSEVGMSNIKRVIGINFMYKGMKLGRTPAGLNEG